MFKEFFANFSNLFLQELINFYITNITIKANKNIYLYPNSQLKLDNKSRTNYKDFFLANKHKNVLNNVEFNLLFSANQKSTNFLNSLNEIRFYISYEDWN
ncbi:hypothetical protein [Spiroplasma tabanidicola]|nr:hypothetical protein [Spiroplasma tabanidicola]